jgi:hypothetical protein
MITPPAVWQIAGGSLNIMNKRGGNSLSFLKIPEKRQRTMRICWSEAFAGEK